MHFLLKELSIYRSGLFRRVRRIAVVACHYNNIPLFNKTSAARYLVNHCSTIVQPLFHQFSTNIQLHCPLE
jgi:hypothetical protein